ncbi:MAG: cation diffusion facilitator family transporter [Nitrospinaceae bacterium]
MDSSSVQSRLKLAAFLTFFVFCLEAAGGIIANSLALISDAAHMLTDVISLVLAWSALKIAARPSTQEKTYGYHRIETFAAFLNGVFLAVMACGILYEAVRRFQSPEVVHSQTVILVAGIGLITNIGVIYFLKNPYRQTRDLNIKAAFYHVVGDTIASLGVLIGAGIMWATEWYLLDALLGAAIAGLLIWGAKSILSDALHILLEGVPKGISLPEVKRALIAIPTIRDIHELHIWSICSNIYALSAHVLVNNQQVNQTESILNDARDLLENKFNITHSTIQIESSPCRASEDLCEIKH